MKIIIIKYKHLLQVNNNHKGFISYKQLLCLTLVTPWTVACQAPLSMEFAVGCHFLLQEMFPTQGSNAGLVHHRQILYWMSHQGSPIFTTVFINFKTFLQFMMHWHLRGKSLVNLGYWQTSQLPSKAKSFPAGTPLMCKPTSSEPILWTSPFLWLLHSRRNITSALITPGPSAR